ncbi:hypothetical protein [Variovorax sp.]|uniref:hypothetical protein n=1 Tax=Variovorax sp. TaxID=1871043 RepID=UPI002D21F3CC|nr:hypothetical protein [Variovorax sp.]HYP86224.1 hypothetical protein [Variovorax sp.]
MYSKFAKLGGLKLVIGTVALAALAACGGGGGSDDNSTGAGAQVVITGTAAKGAMLPSASIQLTCANGTNLSATTGADGQYTTAGQIAYPCIGSATQGNLVYRGILFSGDVANFTPLTDMLVEGVFAASAPGNESLTRAQFIDKLKDATFARNLASSADLYRDVVRNQIMRLLALRLQPESLEPIFAPIRQNFDAIRFRLGSDLDKLLDNTAQDVQNADGSVKFEVLADVKTEADKLPVPGASATGATGGSGS